jgi:aspartyl aminopeptidase
VFDPCIPDFLAFLKNSPTPYHAVEEVMRRLLPAGFVPLEESASWANLKPGKYFVSQSGTNLVAFVLGDGARAVKLIGAHTDSPNLRLKPKAEYASEGYAQLGVEVYGGALLNSWLDRDLGMAGRIIIRSPRGGALRSQLVRVASPVARIPQLAIHLDRDVTEKGLTLNKQEHLAPIWGLVNPSAKGLAEHLAAEAEVDVKDIVTMDVMLYDLTAPTLGGRSEEFIFSARLDNLAMCHAATQAILAAKPGGNLIPLIALFDHEEVGSGSAAGAESAFLPRVLERLFRSRELFHQAMASSACISADMAHAVHPNYAAKHEPRHKPALNAGPVIKTNSQQRYATTAFSAAQFAELCTSVDVPFQQFVNRTDLACGSTIGPITSTQLGIATVDVGNPMLSMHSAREMCGSEDPQKMIRVMTRFLETL